MTNKNEQTFNQSKVIDLEKKLREDELEAIENYTVDDDIPLISPRRLRLIEKRLIEPTEDEREILAAERRIAELTATERKRNAAEYEEVRKNGSPAAEELRNLLRSRGICPDEDCPGCEACRD